MADEKQPERPAGDPKPEEGASQPPTPHAADQPESTDAKSAEEPAKPAPVAAEKPAAATPQTAEKKPADAAPAVKRPVARRPLKKPTFMETTPWADDLTTELKEQFGEKISEFVSYRGQEFLIASPDAVVPILEYLKLEADFDYLVDVTAVDYPKKDERFEVVYVLYSYARNHRIRIKARIKDGERIESVVGVHVTANWLEREVYDMFGIEFANHPDLKRILMPDDWEGWPLRKDEGITKMDEQWVTDNLGIDSAQ